MVCQLFYSVSISVGVHASAIFEIACDLPFPSPLETERFLDCEDKHLDDRCYRGAHVSRYENRLVHYWSRQTHDQSALFMILATPDWDDQLEYYVVKEEYWPEFRDQMEESGWVLMDQSEGLRELE